MLCADLRRSATTREFLHLRGRRCPDRASATATQRLGAGAARRRGLRIFLRADARVPRTPAKAPPCGVGRTRTRVAALVLALQLRGLGGQELPYWRVLGRKAACVSAR